jgi:D-glycero-alpha-D-manno-heptose-7-phosphate kinase
MILVRSPLRVSLFGGGSDYPEWFINHGGAVLGMAINKWCYLGVKAMPPGQGPRYRVVYSKVEDVMEIDKIVHPAVRGCLEYLGIDAPLEIQYAGDLASGGGLGASSSFVVGLLHALRLQFDLNGDHPAQLADEAIYVEREVIREAVGYQDQLFAAFGGLRFMQFRGVNDWRMESVNVTPERTREIEDSLVLVYSGTMRFAHVMAAKQLKRVEQNASLLSEMVSMATSAKRIMEDEGVDLSLVGRMLHAGWQLKRELHPEISSGEIDRLYNHGLSLGALGGKLCGAGGGGFLLFWVPPEQRRYFEEHIGAPCVGFRIAERGTHIVVKESER